MTVQVYSFYNNNILVSKIQVTHFFKNNLIINIHTYIYMYISIYIIFFIIMNSYILFEEKNIYLRLRSQATIKRTYQSFQTNQLNQTSQNLKTQQTSKRESSYTLLHHFLGMTKRVLFLVCLKRDTIKSFELF